MSLFAIYFEPEDWVAFREVRRFNPAGNVRSVIPTSLPFYGAIRTAIMARHGVQLHYHKEPKLTEELKDLIGDRDNPGKIKLYGPFVYSQEKHSRKHYFPAPHNVYKKDGAYKLMLCSPFEETVEGHRLNLAWIPELTNVEEADEPYIELEELKKLREGKEFRLEKPKNYEVEVRTGIALESGAKHVREGMIYTMSTYRFKNGGFFVLTDSEVTASEVSKLDGVFLGGKQRWARVFVEDFKYNLFSDIASENAAALMLTPAIFDGGFIPKDGKLGGVKIKAVVGARRYVVSGWDLTSGQPKMIYHAVSPGAVYYLDGKPSNYSEASKTSQLYQFGFGIFTLIPYKNL